MKRAARDEVERSIARVFRRYGYEGATLGVIAQETGLGRSSLYHHFSRGKEEMAERALALVEQQFAERILPALMQDGEPEGRLARHAEGLRDYYEGGRLGCLVAAFTMQGSPEQTRADMGRLLQAWIDALAGVYAAAGVPEDVSKRKAEHAVAAIQGGLVLASATGDLRHFENALLVMKRV
jgi:TetR/AcrR family transcriptional regulator, lmrAB and yxaGH operons repressor